MQHDHKAPIDQHVNPAQASDPSLFFGWACAVAGSHVDAILFYREQADHRDGLAFTLLGHLQAAAHEEDRGAANDQYDQD